MTRIVKLLVVGLVLVVVRSVAGDLLSRDPSVAYARDATGDFQVIAGTASRDWGIRLEQIRGATQASRDTLGYPKTGHPLQLSSLTILDVSGSAVSRRLAHRIMEQAKSIPEMQRVDVRVPGEPLALERLGELILVL